MTKNYFFILLLNSLNLVAMDRAGHTTLSINSDGTPKDLLVCIANPKAVELLQSWVQSNKSFNDWKKEEVDNTSNNERRSLLELELAGLKELATQVEQLKMQNVTVNSIFKSYIEPEEFDAEYLTKEIPDTPLILHLTGITNTKEISNKLKQSDIVKTVKIGTQQEITKELMSYKIKTVREKNFMCRFSCFTVGCCLSVVFIAGGIVGTWYFMSSEEKELENSMEQLKSHYGCFESLLNICKQSLTDGCQLFVSDTTLCAQGAGTNCCSRNY